MELTLKCANCRSELDAMMEHGEIVVEPCDCQAKRDDHAYGPDADEARTLRQMWGHRC